MSFLENIKRLRGIAAAGSAPPFLSMSSISGGSWGGMPMILRSRNEADDPWINSAYYACLRWMCNTFPESPCVLQKRNKQDPNKWDTLPTHPFTQMMRRPNPNYGGIPLWAGTVLSGNTAGDGFWLKEFNGNGMLSSLYWLPSRMCRPKWTSGSGNFIDGYQVGSSAQLRDPDEIVHFRGIPDPANGGRTSIPPIAAAGLDVRVDQELARSTDTFAHNLGIGVPILSPKAGATINSETAKLLPAQFQSRVTGESRGKAIAFDHPVDVQMVGATPKDMEFGDNRAVSASRICSVLQIDPMVVCLPSDSKTYSNYPEAREAAYEGNIIPQHRAYAETLEIQLLPNFIPDPSEREDYRVWFDTSAVRVLQDDLNKLAERVERLYKGQIIDRFTAKMMMGEQAEAVDKDIYWTGPAAQDPNVDPKADPKQVAKALIEAAWKADHMGE